MSFGSEMKSKMFFFSCLSFVYFNPERRNMKNEANKHHKSDNLQLRFSTHFSNKILTKGKSPSPYASAIQLPYISGSRNTPLNFISLLQLRRDMNDDDVHFELHTQPILRNIQPIYSLGTVCWLSEIEVFVDVLSRDYLRSQLFT